MYYVCLAVSVLAIARGQRDPPEPVGACPRGAERQRTRHEAFAINVVRTKLMAFALSGFLAAVAGCLLVHINQAYTEEPFTATESIGVFTAAVVGGLGSLTGARARRAVPERRHVVPDRRNGACCLRRSACWSS